MKSDNFANFPKKEKSEEARRFELDDSGLKFYKKVLKYLPKPLAFDIFQELELYILGNDFQKKCIKTRSVCIIYAFHCLHLWLINLRFGNSYSLKSLLLKRSLNKMKRIYVKDMVYTFQDFFDRDVYDELLRIQRTLEYSLNDYFLYQFKKRNLTSIIADEILLGEFEEESEEVKKLEDYLIRHMDYLSSLSLNQIEKEHIYWGL